MKGHGPLDSGAPGTTRLFAARGSGLPEHLARFASVPTHAVEDLISSIDAAGLTGRGGAGFPTARKIASVTGRRSVVIGNGAEGEPLSRKDEALLTRAPHLVLDGLQLIAATVDAEEVYLYVPYQVAPTMGFAVDERVAAGLDRRRVRIIEAPDAFVAGEESAVIRRIGGGPALPRDRTVPVTMKGLRARPTLVNNVETLAHVALIARYGPDWFRAVGDPAEPGSMLITLSGTGARPIVLETPTGAPLADVLARGGVTNPRHVRAVLVGGYHGSWLPNDAIVEARLSRRGLARFKASQGAGIVHVLATSECGLARTAAILAYLAEEGAQQCGPCRNGLPMLVQLFHELAYGKPDEPLLNDLRRVLRMLDGRGSCRHPDGTARMARSALAVFADDIAARVLRPRDRHETLDNA